MQDLPPLTRFRFDPSVMTVFRPMAVDIFKRLANGGEDDARQLLEERVRQHFEM